MKQVLCLIAVFFLLTAAKEDAMNGNTYASKTRTPAASEGAPTLPDANTLAILSDPGFQAMFGKGGLFEGTKEEVDNRIAAIEAMTKMGPILQDPNFAATMQAMSAQQAGGAPAAKPAAAKKKAAY